MGRRYHCELCDKVFKDDLEARKKHINSLQHQTAKAEHYQPYRDPKDILEEESKKAQCRKFFKGHCAFGLRCNFSHYTPEELDNLKRKVQKQVAKEAEPDIIDCENVPDIDDWLKKYNDRWALRAGNRDMFGDEISDEYEWTYPAELTLRVDLPPSLVNLEPYHFVSDQFATWG